MKTIVEERIQEVKADDLYGNELIAYRCQSSEAYAVLVKMERTYGFVPLNNSNSTVRYQSNTWLGAVKLALESRQPVAFDTMQEMLTAMVEKRF